MARSLRLPLPRRNARRRPVFNKGPMNNRGLVAAAAPIDLRSQPEARRVKLLRERWQLDSWAYRDSIPEVSFAVRYRANAAGRMRVYPAAFTADGEGEPMTFEEANAEVPGRIPQALIDASADAMRDFANGRVAMAEHMETLSTSFTTTGEAYIVGTVDPETGEDEWNVRSIDEVQVKNNVWQLREVPVDPGGAYGWIPLEAATSVVSRVWVPHPRFKLLADSEMRSILDVCEELMILSKGIRASGRSRLPSGLLGIPAELSIEENPNNAQTDEDSSFTGKLERAMMEPIADEGVASAVVPIVVRGPGEALQQIRLIDFARPYDAIMAQQRQELIGRIATGVDLPKAVLEGLADLNHWTAWAVDDNTFRYHIEPHVRRCVDALTVGYYRMALMSDPRCGAAGGYTVADVAQVLLWYDPTEIVTHPDKFANALSLYNLRELSGSSLRAAAGFSDDDMPTPIEVLGRMIANQRAWPANISLAIAARMDPSLTVPPITGAGLVPGVKGGLAMVPEPPPGTPPPGPVATGPAGSPPGLGPVPAGSSAPPAPEAAPHPVGGPPLGPPPHTEQGAVTMVNGHRLSSLGQAHPRITDRARQLSAKLTAIDRDLRTRLQVLASATLMHELERAGAKLRTKVRTDKALTSAIRSVPNARVAWALGVEVSARFGLDPHGVTASPSHVDLTDLRPTFEAWVQTAQEAALSTAQLLAGPGGNAVRLQAARDKMAAARGQAWDYLAEQIQQLYASALFSSEPSIAKGTQAPLDPETLVPTGVVRRALAIAGGRSPDSVGSADDG